VKKMKIIFQFDHEAIQGGDIRKRVIEAKKNSLMVLMVGVKDHSREKGMASLMILNHKGKRRIKCEKY